MYRPLNLTGVVSPVAEYLIRHRLSAPIVVGGLGGLRNSSGSAIVEEPRNVHGASYKRIRRCHGVCASV